MLTKTLRHHLIITGLMLHVDETRVTLTHKLNISLSHLDCDGGGGGGCGFIKPDFQSVNRTQTRHWSLRIRLELNVGLDESSNLTMLVKNPSSV